MTKLLGRLRRAGLVRAVRGRAGGYALALPAGEVSLWRVASALEEPAPERHSLALCATCPLLNCCPIKTSQETAERHVRQELEGLTVETLGDLLSRAGGFASTAGHEEA